MASTRLQRSRWWCWKRFYRGGWFRPAMVRFSKSKSVSGSPRHLPRVEFRVPGPQLLQFGLRCGNSRRRRGGIGRGGVAATAVAVVGRTVCLPAVSAAPSPPPLVGPAVRACLRCILLYRPRKPGRCGAWSVSRRRVACTHGGGVLEFGFNIHASTEIGVKASDKLLVR